MFIDRKYHVIIEVNGEYPDMDNLDYGFAKISHYETRKFIHGKLDEGERYCGIYADVTNEHGDMYIRYIVDKVALKKAVTSAMRRIKYTALSSDILTLPGTEYVTANDSYTVYKRECPIKGGRPKDRDYDVYSVVLYFVIPR